MTKFYSEDTKLPVSKLIMGKYWGGNFTELVKKGTGLSPDFTTALYNPSGEDKTGIYDSVKGQWTEITNNSLIDFYSPDGEKYNLPYPDDVFPDWAIFDKPPKYDPEKETVLYIDSTVETDDIPFNQGWNVNPIQIGEKYWDYDGTEFTVTDFNFILPKNHTMVEKPDVKDGFLATFNGVTWDISEDNIGELKYGTVIGSSEYKMPIHITSPGDIGADYTLLEPGAMDKWDGSEWVLDQDLVDQQTTRYNLGTFDTMSQVITRLAYSYQLDQIVDNSIKVGLINESQFNDLMVDRKNLMEWLSNPLDDFPPISNVLQQAMNMLENSEDLLNPPYM